MVTVRSLSLLLLSVACSAPPAGGPTPAQVVRTDQTSGTAALLIAVSPVDESIVWVSGSLGTWARTLDGGSTWRSGRVSGADSLQFRDVHAVDANTAYLLSIGNGSQSRIYKTTDGGQTARRRLDLIGFNRHATFSWGPSPPLSSPGSSTRAVRRA